MAENPPDKTSWVKAAIERYEEMLVRYAAHITGDRERARDVVQDTFLRLCAEEPARLDGHLAEWLFTVCRHRALDIQRKESRMRPMKETDRSAPLDADRSPPIVVERKEALSEILTALGNLPANQQEVVRLKFQAGLKYEEISKITGLSVSNVGFLLHTAVRTIRKKLQPPHEGAARKE